MAPNQPPVPPQHWLSPSPEDHCLPQQDSCAEEAPAFQLPVCPDREVELLQAESESRSSTSGHSSCSAGFLAADLASGPAGLSISPAAPDSHLLGNGTTNQFERSCFSASYLPVRRRAQQHMLYDRAAGTGSTKQRCLEL